MQVVKAEGSQERLADRVSAKLRQGGLLATTYGARNVRMDLDGPLREAWERGHVRVGDLWSYYRRYPYLTRLRDRAVLEGTLRAGLDDMMWESEGFALAESYDDVTGRYDGPANFESGAIDSREMGLATVLAMTLSEQMALGEVKNRLSEVVDRLEREHGRVVITKHGRPAAVVLSIEDLESLEETLDVLSSESLMADIREALAERMSTPPVTLSKDEALRLLRDR